MKQHNHTTTSSQGSHDMRRDPQGATRAAVSTRERDKRFSIMIDEPPREGLYVQVMNQRGQVIARVLPPNTGHLELHFSDGLFRGGKIFPTLEKV